MVCGAPLNYKWKQKGLSSAFLPERDSDSLAWAGHICETGGDTHTNTYPDTQTPSPDPTKSSLLISLVLDY